MTAWMLGNDGIAIPVEYHPYIMKDNLELSLFSAEWLFRNTNDFTHKGTAMKFLYEWALESGLSEETLIQWVESEIFGKPERGPNFQWNPSVPAGLSSRELIKLLIHNPMRNSSAAELVLEKLTKSIAVVLSNETSGKLPLCELEKNSLFTEIKDELNQHFLRIHYGEMQDRITASGEMVFRISSICFDWYPLILETLKTSPYKVETVTIIRDSGVAGAEDTYYKTYDGKKRYKQMPIDDFYEEVSDPANKRNHLYNRKEYSSQTKEDIQYISRALADGSSIIAIMERYSERYDYLMKELMRERISETLAGGKTIYDAMLLCNSLAKFNILLAELKEEEEKIASE